MRIAVLSDSHGRIHNCLRALHLAGPIDHIIHLGDNARDTDDIGLVYPETPISSVSGNCDLFAGEPLHKMVELAGKRFFLCHGHSFRVKESLSALALAAQSADLALFGHTHEVFDGVVDNVRLFNPGSIALPASGAPAFGIITIENDSIRTEHKTL